MEKKLSFEDGLKRLETIVKALEGGNVSLDDSIKMFEEGVSLSAHCNKLLETAQQKVFVLVNGENGEMKEEEFAKEAPQE